MSRLAVWADRSSQATADSYRNLTLISTRHRVQAARGISDDGIRYGQPGPPVVPAPGVAVMRGAYSGILAVSIFLLPKLSVHH